MSEHYRYDVCVVGGCGHVGLPLALTFADRGLRVSVYDTNEQSVATVASGRMPFLERGAEPVLERVIGKQLEVSSDPRMVEHSRHVVIVIGTPVDEHLNPTFHAMRRFFKALLPHLRDGQCLILRSTVYPGTTEKVRDLVADYGRKVHVAFCPERVAEGKAMHELVELPQLVSGCDETAVKMASDLFRTIARSIITLSPLEAELTKMFANAWRYIQFAAANQFFMIANDHGLDFYRIYDALTRDYPRMTGLPGSGFAAGPCLFKDTMQLAAVNHNNFNLGHAAMLINEGLPNYIVSALGESCNLSKKTVGILGMAFKGDSDDPRESLSFKLRKILEYEAGEVLCTDVYINDPCFRPLQEVIERSEVLIVGAPHCEYRSLQLPAEKTVIDIWNIYGKGARIACAS
jgi:UDP-N-acetyl-D-mannosaminuronic acid dehydrogenase